MHENQNDNDNINENENEEMEIKSDSLRVDENEHNIEHTEKNYNFSEEELENYYEIFTSIFTYLKLIIQRNVLNDIISYGELKFRYKIGFEQLILLFKHKPFNNLRLLQQKSNCIYLLNNSICLKESLLVIYI